MLRRVAIGCVSAGFALGVAVQSRHEVVRAAAAFTSLFCLSFTTTTLILAHRKERKRQEAIADAYVELLRQVNRRRQSVDEKRPSACRGCVNYHGKIYSGHQLICAMHPYGVSEDRCTDWEGKDSTTRDWTDWN
jgi:hypothetical protein